MGLTCGAKHQTVNCITWDTWATSVKAKISKALFSVSFPAFLRPGEGDRRDKIVILLEGSDSEGKKIKK